MILPANASESIMRRFPPAISLLLWILGSAVTCADEGTDFFEAKVRPLLVKHCYECHSGEKTKGGLALDTKSGWEKGGDSGSPISSGEPDKSLLITAIRYQDLEMPP
ncbi:MAG: c-type cytochrome domain-containing protein [Pirellula sp.]